MKYESMMSMRNHDTRAKVQGHFKYDMQMIRKKAVRGSGWSRCAEQRESATERVCCEHLVFIVYS